MSTPYGYGGRPQDRVGPPPGVLPPPAQYGGPYYGPGPGQFNGFQPRRRRSSALRLVLIGFFSVAFLGIALSVLAVVLTSGSSSADGAGPQIASGPSVVPTAKTNAPKGSPEDYLLNAPIYKVGGLGELNCKAEDLGDGSLAAQKVYYEKLFKCLNDGWRPAFAKMGKHEPDPGLVVFDQPVDGPCGHFEPLSGRVLAFYCFGNHVMYTDVKQMNQAFGPKQDLAFLMTIAHEYGHHVQSVSDLFYARQAYLADHPDEKLESSRRNELQASCFAGVFSRAVEKSYPFTARLKEFEFQASNSFGETPKTPASERTHGLATSQGYWIVNGLNVGETKACNTYAATQNQVK
ncbi:MAG: uncharacterized protein QOH84_3514 [Kribbellaceae bacterium]|nr:uncharacterized protein [Kribbellaceae bacterium]